MNRFSNYIKEIQNNKKLKKNLFLLTMGMIIFLLVIILKPNDSNTTYLTDAKGNLVEIERRSIDRTDNYKLRVSVVNDESIQNEIVEINKKAVSKETKTNNNTNHDEKSRDDEIAEMITELELSKSKNLKLPQKLSDGSYLIWEKESESYVKFLIIPFVYFLLVIMMVKSRLDKGKNEDSEKRAEILKGLPRFVNQLLLMMNAGMILSDAFAQISKSYELIEEKGYFEENLIEVAEANKEHRVSTATVINEWASGHNVKELMRISTILTENERRGSDIIDNLNRESKYLWDDRKIVAREKGKMIDTKMSYPMGLLLLLLIVITMAPAILNM